MFVRLLQEVWNILKALSPWLFLGAGLAGLLKVYLPSGFVSRHVGHSTLGSVLKSVVLGIPLPLCSCGVIPTAIGLKKDGASNGASVGFLISTPQTGLDSILVTASFLGWPLALFKVLAAFLTGVLGGGAVNFLDPGKAASPPDADAGPGTACLGDCPAPPAAAAPPRLQILVEYAVQELIGGIYRYLLIGIVVAALISVLIPPRAIAGIPALQGLLGMAVMLLISIPLYVCSTGSVPIAASLIQAGLPLGSALVFLMAGPATNAATIGAIFRTFGRKIAVIYLAVIIAGSVAFGLLFQAVIASGAGTGIGPHEHGLPAWRQVLDNAAALALSLLLAYWCLRDLRGWWRNRLAARATARSVPGATYQIEGMTCQNCVRHVREALAGVAGVRQVEVDLDSGRARVRGTGWKEEDLLVAVRRAGYTARRIGP